MKYNSKRTLISSLLVFLASLFLSTAYIYALEQPMNVTEISNGGMPNTKFTIYMNEEALEDRYDYYHVYPEEVADKEKEVYLKLVLTEPKEIWTDLIKVGAAGGIVCCDVLMGDKKTVISSRNIRFSTFQGSSETVFRGALPAGTYYFYFHDNIEGDCIPYTEYWLQVSVFKSLVDDDQINANNTKVTATRIGEDEDIYGFLNAMGTDPADWYVFTVTGEIGKLHVESSSWRGMNSVLLRSEGTEVEGGRNLTATGQIELSPGTYYLGYQYERDDNPSAGRSYKVWLTQESVLKGLTLNHEEITLRTNDFDSLSAIVVPEDAHGVTVSWSSSDESIVTVKDFQNSTPSQYNNTNIYSGDKTGTAIITVKTTDGSNLSASCKVTVVERQNYHNDSSVKPQPVTTDTSGWYINFKYDRLTLKKGETKYIDHNSKGGEKPVWKSSDETIVTVDGWKITARKAGNATVTAYFKSYPQIKAECVVTVTNESNNGDGASYYGENEYGYYVSTTEGSSSTREHSSTISITEAATIKASKSTVQKGKKTTVKITANSGGKITIKGKSKNARNKKYVKISGSKIVFQKKAPKGTYKFTVTSAAKGNYTKTTKTISIKVK